MATTKAAKATVKAPDEILIRGARRVEPVFAFLPVQVEITGLVDGEPRRASVPLADYEAADKAAKVAMAEAALVAAG